MVDKERRKKLARHLRHLSTGIITNDKFENEVMNDVTNGWLPEQYPRSKQSKSDDPAMVPILAMSWGLYSDTKTHKLNGKYQLPDKSLKIIAHSILFLHSDLEYEWPEFDDGRLSLVDILFSLLTLGWFYRKRVAKWNESFKEYQKLGDYEYWPFFRKLDYENQLDKRPFLNPQNT